MDRLTRLHRCLVAAIREMRPDAPDGRITVAEIYQDLVPYRVVREALDLGLNADYEHLVLRLLAGEGDLVRMEPEEARAELHRELESPNPNVGLFRRFAACDVRVRTPPEDEEPARAAEEVPAEVGAGAPLADSGPETGRAPGSEPAAGVSSAAVRSAEDESAAGASPSAAAGDGSAAGTCPFCASDLPADREARYCPYCGADQRLLPCPACGESVERSWSFCVACGAAVRTQAAD